MGSTLELRHLGSVRERRAEFQDPQMSVTQERSGLWCRQGRGHAMASAHRHDDLEVNIVDDEPLTYLFGGTLVTIQPGHAALFWASVPHRLIDTPHNWNARVRWLHVPLGQ